MIALRPSRQARKTAKGWLKWLRRATARRLHGFDGDDLARSLRRLGVEPGDVLLAHSSWDRFEAFRGKPSDVIQILEAAVGPAGTLLMPTLPFTGTAADWAERGAVFDVARTPSAVGLLTELFRRSPGVVRSVHPTHSVAAWGARAAVLTADHHRARTPCGAGTPFARLLDHRGRILFLGAGIESMTFFHAVEELLEPEMPFSPFTAATFTLRSRDSAGRVVETTTRLFDPGRSRRRNLLRLVPVLKAHGAWRVQRVGGMDVVLVAAADVLDACRDLAKNGVYCYDD